MGLPKFPPIVESVCFAGHSYPLPYDRLSQPYTNKGQINTMNLLAYEHRPLPIKCGHSHQSPSRFGRIASLAAPAAIHFHYLPTST